MADRLRLVLLTPEQQLVDDEVFEVTAPGAYGEIGVLPDHAALVTTLGEGVVSYKTPGGVRRIEIGGGFAEVRDNVMTVLATAGVRGA
jgi:F-type H+-transporting ATPase subunit epsilon